MEPEFDDGSVLIVNRAAYALHVPFSSAQLTRWALPQRGEAIVFNTPQGGRPAVKRVVGIPGDPVRKLNGAVSVSDRTYVVSVAAYSELSRTATIPEGQLFVLGDNQRASFDSRDYGLVPIDSVRGRVFRRIEL